MTLHAVDRTSHPAIITQRARAPFHTTTAHRTAHRTAGRTALALVFSLALLPLTAQAGDGQSATPVDPAVQQALVYKMPENTCKAPVERIRSEGNSNALKFERMTRNYKKCLSDYAETLTKDRDAIRAATNKGVTPDQAAIIQPKVNALSNAIVAATSS